jgi:hypothetical protein
MAAAGIICRTSRRVCFLLIRFPTGERHFHSPPNDLLSHPEIWRAFLQAYIMA